MDANEREKIKAETVGLWREVALNTAGMDESRVHSALAKVYKEIQATCPRDVRFVDGPDAAHALMVELGITDPNLYVWPSFWGQQEASWLAYYDLLIRCDELPADYPRSQIEALMELGREAGWCWMWEDLVIVCARPIELHYSEAGELHCTTGPAVRYKTGEELYALHGTEVDGYYINTPKDQVDAARLLAEPNATVRTRLIQHIGLARIAAKLNRKTISTSASGNEDLEEYEIQPGSFVRGLRVRWTTKPAWWQQGHPEGEEAIIPVPTTKEEWAAFKAPAQLEPEFDPDNADHVRLMTFDFSIHERIGLNT